MINYYNRLIDNILLDTNNNVLFVTYSKDEKDCFFPFFVVWPEIDLSLIKEKTTQTCRQIFEIEPANGTKA